MFAAPTPWALDRSTSLAEQAATSATAGTTTFSNPITLNGIGTTIDGYAKPAIYSESGGGVCTLSGQITLAATSDIGNYKDNGMLTLSGKITGPGGSVDRKADADADRRVRSDHDLREPPATTTAAARRSTAARSTCRRPTVRSPFPPAT